MPKTLRLKALKLIFLSTLAILGGCAAVPLTIPVTPEEASQIRGSTITITHQQTQGFMFNTPSTALVNAGMAEWVDPSKAITWRGILDGNRVPDFTESVADEFKNRVFESIVFVDSGQTEPFDQSADFSRLTNKYNTDYILEIRTFYGGFVYGPLAWNTYNLNYSADAVVVRASDQTPVWKMKCDIGPEEGNPLKVPGEDFLKEDGDKLRAAADYATTYCGQQLAQQFLSRLGK